MMNKQLTKKTIGIAASAALMASLAFSGSAFAAPGNGKAVKNGPKGSISVFSICYLEADDPANAMLRVETTITDTSSVPGDATLKGMEVQAQEKIGKNRYDIGDVATADPVLEDGVAEVSTTLPLCTSLLGDKDTLSADAKSANAEITVWITDDHNNKEDGFISRCSDDPDTLYVDEVAQLNVFKQGLCQ
jgi:hypothetical protein